MDMHRAFAVLLLASAFHALPARAAEPRLVCFGDEPSWSLRFDGGGRATLAFRTASRSSTGGGRRASTS